MTSLVDLLRQRAERDPDRLAIRFYAADGWQSWTWAEFWQTARRVAGGLRDAGLRPGQNVLAMVPHSRPAVATLFGIWTAGGVPIQIGRPFRLDDIAGLNAHFREVADRFDVKLAAVGREVAAHIEMTATPPVVIAEDLSEAAAATNPATTRTDLIQLTSGSVATPRGVVIPNDRLLAHLAAISQALPPGDDAVGVSWLPLHHDMGLIGGLLYPYYNDFVVNLMSPLDFRRNPYLWLRSVSAFRATHTVGPPSAYALIDRFARRAASDQLDFGDLRCAMVGAEPIAPNVLHRVANGFEQCGFRASAFLPVYGLAEATVAATFAAPAQPPRVDRVSAAVLARQGQAATSDAEDALAFTSVGRPIAGVELRIDDGAGGEAEERIVGPIMVRTASGMTGYYDDPEATEEAFDGDWLRTGDLGYVADGDLYVTGRQKELIIRAGRNLVPSVVEQIAADVDGVRPGGVAAVGIRNEQRSTEHAVLVAETRLKSDRRPELAERIQSALKHRGMDVDQIRFVDPHTLPKTSSGKLRRRAIARSLEVGEL